MAVTTRELFIDLSPLIKLYTDDTVDRVVLSPNVPPSPEDAATGVASKDITISPAISARLHLPKLTNPSQKLPILLYFHIGGFCTGSAFSLLDFRYLNLLSAESGALIVSVEYRLAPEHPLPAAYEDSWYALQWICSHAVGVGHDSSDWIANYGDFARIFIAGDSAGGNIAHNIAMRAGSDPLPGNVKLTGAILSHPHFWGSDPVGNEPEEDREENLLHRVWIFAYPSGGIDDPWINPFVDGAPSLSGLGCERIMVSLAEKDILTARGRRYAAEVKKSGWKGAVEVVEVEGEDHCFHYFDSESEKALGLIKRMAAFISQPVVTLVYPMYASIRAIETRSVVDDQHWLTYWVVYSMITLLELTFSNLIHWLPLWSYAKLIFTCWLVIPFFSGAGRVYKHIVRPYLITREKKVDIWYVPGMKDVFRKQDDIIIAAQKYMQLNGPEAFENMIHRSNREAMINTNNFTNDYTLYDDNYKYEDDDHSHRY